MALLVSGGLLLSYDINSMQEQIDQSKIDPLDPHLIKEMIKAIARVDNNVNLNAKAIQLATENVSDIFNMVTGANNKIAQLQQEIDELKRKLRKLNKAKK
ncbi:hypothetical protein [Helicobacter pylori]|uniref:hypothetical protein n=1 Tax=Helicobacter pylori TaxID=210 RepID=UPI000EB59462|nr:hypothetical protein [Helicobacter pylori]